MSKENIFAIMWDCNGLEAAEQIPDPALATFAVLQGREPPRPPNINMWTLRARVNTQRNYEIYIVHATPEITREDIVSMFEADPQTAADTIRRLGHKFYSDRATQPRAIVWGWLIIYFVLYYNCSDFATFDSWTLKLESLTIWRKYE